MCDGTGIADHGWKGWQELPQPRFPDVERQGGPWVDLSHRLNNDLPRVSFFPKPSFRLVMQIPNDPINVTEIQMVVHVGTHVDAPRHFYVDGPAFHEIPPERLFGPGVVLRFAAEPDQVITAADLEACGVEVMSGDIVVVDTGWAQYFGQEMYDAHPALSTDAAQWLVDKRVKLVGSSRSLRL